MKKRVTCVLATTILLIAILSNGCSQRITHGEVYAKEHRESTTTTMLLPLSLYNGTTTTTTYVPYMVYYPDRFVIFIKAFVDEEWITEDFYVSESVYNQINIGDMFEFQEERGDLEDEPYTKEKIRDK